MHSRRFFIKSLASTALFTALPLPITALASQPVAAETRLLMGTFVSIKIFGASASHAEEAAHNAFSRMAALETILTRYDSGSPLSQLNAAGKVDAPQELQAVTSAALHFHTQTAGAFDPTILPLLELFEQHKTSQPRLQLDEKEMADSRALINMDNVHQHGSTLSFARSGMKMSLDGIAKGYIADAGAQSLLQSGISNFLLDAGGDIIARGSKAGTPWNIAVENPQKYHGATSYPAVHTLTDQSIATSGSYEVQFDADGFCHHLINPTNGQSPSLRSVSVIAPTAMEADALATAFSVMSDPIAAAERLHRPCCLIQHNGAVQTSSLWA